MTHKELKEEGYKEMLTYHSNSDFTPAQLEIVRSFYDYGWCNAYGLNTEDKSHKEIMNMLKQLQTKRKQYGSS